MLYAGVVAKYKGARFDAVRAALPEMIADGLKDGGEIVRMRAMSNILNEGHGLTGALADSLRYDPGRVGRNKVNGYVRTGALPQAKTLEFGTGIYSTQGTGSPPWFVHEDMAPDLALYFTKYKREMPNGTLKQTQFYYLVGAQPHPYLKPAATATKNEVNEAVRVAVRKGLGEILP